MRNPEKIAALTRQLLEELGEDPAREGLVDTPERVAKSLLFLTKGYQQDPHKLINGAVFSAPYDEMVVLKDIDFYSLCEHHMLPFFGKVHVAYLPKGKIIGLSKIPRIVDAFARRLQVQEQMTYDIANCLNDHLKPMGIAVVIEAFHLCMAMRGVEKQSSRCVTSTMLGAFRNDSKTRNEFLQMISGVSSHLTR
jgi:GTP cyclohydrolase I